MRLSLNVLELIYVTPCHFHLLGLNKITLIIETNRPSHSDTKKLDHFTKVTHYLLLSQLSIFQQKAERETIALLNELKDVTLSPLFTENYPSGNNGNWANNPYVWSGKAML